MTRLTAFAFALIALGCAQEARAQSASTTGSGSITVIRPLTLTKTADLKFGAVVRPASGSGAAAVSVAGVRSVTGGVTALASGDAPQAAQFSVAGEGGQSVSITIPATFNMTSGANVLIVSTTHNLAGSTSNQVLSGAMGSAGSLLVRVGGTVPILATTASGAYAGAFTVTTAYN